MDDPISRAALLKDLSYCAPELWHDEEYVKAKIMKQPAVDAVPVVHGRWVENEDCNGDPYYTCSACGETWVLIDGTPSDNNMDYCPRCGAKMGGRIEDGQEHDPDALPNV